MKNLLLLPLLVLPLLANGKYKSKEAKFYMGIGTNIKEVANYDFGSPISSPSLFKTSPDAEWILCRILPTRRRLTL